ncbi:MAG: hypothetical protein ACLFPL_01325 [Candidatus Nanoarchaeia archaeon]
MKGKYAPVLINSNLEDVKKKFDRNCNDCILGIQYGGLTLASAHYSTQGIEDINILRSNQDTLLRLHRQSDSRSVMMNRGIGLVSILTLSGYSEQDSISQLLEIDNHRIVDLKGVKLIDIEKANSKEDESQIARIRKKFQRTNNEFNIFVWNPTLYGLDKTNGLIKYLAEPKDERRRNKLEDLLVSI